MSPRVLFEPIGEEIDCDEEESILDAAFRAGFNLVYGCREGQCSACKAYLLEGEVVLKPYSTFALSESEESNGYTLLCRAMPEEDLVVELLHFDPDNYRLENPIRDGRAEVESVESLTADIRLLTVRVDEPADFSFVPGQYVDLWVPGSPEARRSFSMANLPGDGRIELVHVHGRDVQPHVRLALEIPGESSPRRRLWIPVARIFHPRHADASTRRRGRRGNVQRRQSIPQIALA